MKVVDSCLNLVLRRMGDYVLLLRKDAMYFGTWQRIVYIRQDQLVQNYLILGV